MELKLYDTLTREKRAFRPLDPANVRMYVCGPTVYDFAHIGNARPVIVFDVLFRLLRHLYGPDHVTYVRNITDVDDKINARAIRDYPGLPLNEAIRKVTEATEAQFQADVTALGCLQPTHQPRATEFVLPRSDGRLDMKSLIQQLLDGGNAYIVEGTEGKEVLFDVSSMPDYGALSGRKLEDQKAGARVAVDAHKKNPEDFVLWKESGAKEPGWEGKFRPDPRSGYEAEFILSPENASRLGRNSRVITIHGRPGWHIECSAMSAAYLDKVFDIHGGGLDLIFPHHENEIAQSRCAFHTPAMANYWIHNGFLQVEGEKMSKSLGNFVTINELLKEWPGRVVRLAMLSSHYRQPINWTEKGLNDASEELLHWSTTLWQVSEGSLMLWAQREPSLSGPSSELIEALSDDLNTPAALTVLRSHHEKARSRDPVKLIRFAQDVRFLELLDFEKLGVHNPYDVTNGPDMIAVRFREESKRLKAAYANGFPQAVSSLISSIRDQGADVHIQENGSLTFSSLSSENLQFEQRIKELILERDAARARKDWKESDRIRDELAKMGIVLKDSKDGTTWELAR